MPEYFFITKLDESNVTSLWETKSDYYEIYPDNTIVFVHEENNKSVIDLVLKPTEWLCIYNDYGIILEDNKYWTTAG